MGQEHSIIGKEIGSYRLVAEIAQGGSGAVYQAQHMILANRVVAIKLLHDLHLNSAQEREHFLQEAQFLEKLKHPYILPLIDVGIQQGVPFLVTEYATNGSLRSRIQNHSPHPISFQEAIIILSQIGQALQYAHQQNILHRDLKPDNILFNAQNSALLADFGIAVILSTTSVRYTSVTGTPAYMAPEQFRGNVSRETDQYALGCIAYELFTGQKPFTASNFVAMGFKHTTEQPMAPRHLNPSIPEAIEWAILKAMAKERGGRHPDIALFIAALQLPTLYNMSTPAWVKEPDTVPVSLAPTQVPILSTGEPSLKPLQSSSSSIPTTNSLSHRPTRGERVWVVISYISISSIFILLWPITSLIFYSFFFWPIASLIIYCVGRKKHFMRFHMMQSFLFLFVTILLSLMFGLIGYNSGDTTFASDSIEREFNVFHICLIVFAIVNVILILSVLQGKYFRLPFIGSMAKKFANRINKKV